MQRPRELFGGLGNSMFQMAYIYAQMREGKVPDIYLQDFNYFDKYRDEIKAWYGKGIVKSDCISLHIRRGDYVNNPYYVDLFMTDYYKKAIAEFPNEKFLIFCKDRQEGSDDTDDRIWCTRYLRGLDIYPERADWFWGGVSNDTEINDFNNMAGCKGHILANSSFSFWASYIGEGKTIAPSKWFADGRSIPLPEEWIQI